VKVIKDIEQGSEEWHEMRRGVITASRFKDVIAKGAGKTRNTYMMELAAEILTGEHAPLFTNQYMEWGTQTEPQAKAMYELNNSLDVVDVAFITNDLIAGVGVSPDGLIGSNGLIEIKCPKTTTQFETFLSGKMPSSHKAQVQGQLWISGREWCDFVSFDPRINGESSWFSVRVHRDDQYIHNLKESIDIFKNDLNELIQKLKG